MPTYKGIPFNGGMNAPTGTGAQNIVQTCEAICDWAIMADAAGVLKDTGNLAAVDWGNRQLTDTAGLVVIDWESGQLTGGAGNGDIVLKSHALRDPVGNPTVDWVAMRLYYNNTLAYDWSTGEIHDHVTGNVGIQVNNGVFMPNLPTADPSVSGQLWNNFGVITISP